MSDESNPLLQAKFQEPKFKDGKILAFADVDVAHGMTVKGFRVVSGEQGVFAAVPSRPVTVAGQTRYMNQVVFSDPSTKETFLTDLLECYHAWKRDDPAGSPATSSSGETRPAT